MAETTPSVGDAKPETAQNSGRTLSRRKFVGGIGAGLGLAMAGMGTASATETSTATPTKPATGTSTPEPTKSPTSTSTSTPNPFAAEQTAVAGAQATAGVVQTREALVQTAANARETAVTAQDSINAKLGTPTKTPTPNPSAVAAASATAKASVEADWRTRVAAVDAVSTARAKPTGTDAQKAQATAEAMVTKVAIEEKKAIANATTVAAQKKIDDLNAPPKPTPIPPPQFGGAVEAVSNLPTAAKVISGIGAAAVLAGADQLFAKGKGRGVIGEAGGGVVSFAKKAPAGIWGFITSKLAGGGAAPVAPDAEEGETPAGDGGVVDAELTVLDDDATTPTDGAGGAAGGGGGTPAGGTTPAAGPTT